MDGMTLGSPIAILVRNKDQKSKDYKEMQVAYRPSHAGAWAFSCVSEFQFRISQIVAC